MTSIERIVTNHQIMLGKPFIKGTRITVEVVLRKLSQGATQEEIVKMYPELSLEDISAALFYAIIAIKGGEESFGFAA